MKIKNPFSSLFSKNNRIAGSTPPNAQPTGWEDLASLSADSQGGTTTFDSLATEVPFAGDEPSNESNSSPHVLPEIPAKNNLEFSDSSEQQESEISPDLQAFKNFFKIDLRIKRELMQAAPSQTDDFDEGSRMKYVDDAYHTYKDFRSDFAQIEQDFHLGETVQRCTDEFFRRGAEHFAPSRYDASITKKIYQEEFTDMRRDFIEKVKNKFVGYKLVRGNLGAMIAGSRSVNELLHAYHSFIMNNENILQNVPPVSSKENSSGYSIVLRGEETALSKQLFDSISDDLNIGDTDIVSADENIMMMVRNRGHALTISAEPDGAQPDKMWVEYNVPKLCNIEKIKALPGLSGCTENGASGGFFVSRNEFGSKISEFIVRVPNDKDMFEPGGIAYVPPSPQNPLK